MRPHLAYQMNVAHLIDRDDERGYVGAFLGFQFAVGR